MKKLLSFLTLLVVLCFDSFADDRLRDVQAELKTQGFFYGEVNGRDSQETSAAVRRYQIRNGLEVTGTLTDETVTALGIGAAPAPRPTPEEIPPPAPPAASRGQNLKESDKSFLRREVEKERAAEPASPLEEDPSVVPAPRPLHVPSADLAVLFAETPYGSAPPEVQEDTLRRAQAYLASRGLYRAAIDGEAGPATEEAILSYQRSLRLPLTGRLDLETLNKLRLMPGRSPVPLKGFVPEQTQTSGQRVFRGIWVR